jgi:hypothetical protein
LGIQQLYQQAAATVAGFGAVKTLLIPKYQHVLMVVQYQR